MSQFAAEPLPSEIDPVLSEYLDRQFNAIQLSFMAKFTAPYVTALPQRPIVGGIVYLRDQDDPTHNGFYCCIEDNQGEGEWKGIETTDLPTGLARLSAPLY